MPLDINMFRAASGGNPDAIRESQRRRYAPVEMVDEIIAKDDKWRFLTGTIDNLRKERNTVQKEVANKKKAGQPCDDLVAEIKRIGDEITKVEDEQKVLKEQVDSMINKIGNIVDDSVPVSQDEDADNVVVRKWGTPRDPAGLLNHHDLLWRIGGYEPERGTAVAGHRGYFLRDVGVMLNQAFINYGIAFLRKRGYCCLQPPYMMKKDVMAGVAQLEQFDEELYKIVGSTAEEDAYLIATSEQPICGYHKDEWMDEKSLPLRYAGISTCFRKEAGKHGKDTWGIFRVHQFEKVEQFVVCEGDLELSKKMQDEMIQTAEEFYQSLGFPYHVINIVSGALNNAAIKKLDLEAWFPGYNAYRELVSCSNCTDYQSRAMEIRCGQKKLGEREKKYVHMLNATLCATGRAICCLLENYQEADGVRIPEVLVPFMGGLTFLPFVRESRDAGKAAPAKAEGGAGAGGAGAGKKADSGAGAGGKPPAPAAGGAGSPSKPPQAPQGSGGGPKAAEAAVVAHAEEVPAELQPLVAKITTKGEEIRVAKANKGDKDAIKALVDELLALKLEYKDKTGKEYGAPAGAAGAAPKDDKKKARDTSKPAATPKAAGAPAAGAAPAAAKFVPCTPPAVPVKAPAYTTPAPPKVSSNRTPITMAAVKSGIATTASAPVASSANASDLATLEAKLALYSYINGFQPSKADATIFAGMSKDANLTQMPNVGRWYRHIASYTEQEREQWK